MDARPTLGNLSALIGEPAHLGDRVAIHEGDCLELMRRLPDESIPIIVTSPPYYGVGKNYEKQGQTLGEYVDWLLEWMSEAYRVLTDDGTLWLNLGYTRVPGRGTTVPIFYLLWERLPEFHLVQEIIWHHRAGIGGYRRRFAIRSDRLELLTKRPPGYVFNLDAVRDPDVRYPPVGANSRWPPSQPL